MQKIRYGLIALSILFSSVTTAKADISIGIGLPNVSIGINLPLFPQLVPVPGYPVYYAPQVNANYFFYDGMYWVYQDDNWFASSWYNGPWDFVEPEVVPLFVLRIPVRYYRQPPPYFHGWQSNAPPRWGQHWGHGWEKRRVGWDRWKRSAAPSRAPLPAYQRHYSGDRYPRAEQQHELRDRSYRYQPRDKAVRQHYKQRIEQKAPAPAQRGRQEEQEMKGRGQQQPQPRQVAPHQQPQQVAPHQQPQPRYVAPHQQNAPVDPRLQHQQRGGENIQRPNADHAAPQQRQAPRAQEQEQKSHDRGEQQDHGRGRGQGQDKDKDDDRGRGRDK